jgi:tetratricopeptide (TPR) repeat protein
MKKIIYDNKTRAYTGLSLRLLWPLAIGVLTFFVYYSTLANEFVNWDDSIYVYRNELIKSLDYISYIFSPQITPHWYPVTILSFALDYQLWELNPFGYHLTNITLHSLNTILVFILIKKLTRLTLHLKHSYIDAGSERVILAAATITAILFGIHPIHVESVAWISARKDLLSTLFLILSILSYLSYARRAGKIRILPYVLSIIFFSVSLLSKPMAVTLPVLLLLLDYLPLARFHSAAACVRTALIDKLPYLALSISSIVMTIWTHHSVGAINIGLDLNLFERIFFAARSYLFYLYKMLYPLELAPMYSYPSKVAVLSLEFLIPFMIVLALTAASIRFIKKSPLLPTLWLFYLIMLLPVIGIISFGAQPIADRYTYLPSIVPFLAIALGVGLIFKKAPGIIQVITLALIIFISTLLSLKTTAQSAVWKDSITLWTYELSINPTNSIAFNNRGSAYLDSDMTDNAFRDYSEAIKHDPTIAISYENRARLYIKLSKDTLAMEDLNHAIKLKPRFVRALIARSSLYKKKNNYRAAVDDLNRALEIDSNYKEALFARATLNIGVKNYYPAIEDFSKLISIDPGNASAFYKRARAYELTNRDGAALSDLNRAIRIDPSHLEALNSRAVLHAMRGDYHLAIPDFRAAIKLNPKDKILYENLATAYERSGRYKEADIERNKAVKLP